MRHGRAKAARKTLQYFSRTLVGFSPTVPYRILVDATFVVALHRAKVADDDILHRMDRLLHVSARKNPTTNQFESSTRYYICKEALEELKDLVSKLTEQAGSAAAPTTTTQAFEDALDWVNNHCTVLDNIITNGRTIEKEGDHAENDSGANDDEQNDDDQNETPKKKRRRKRNGDRSSSASTFSPAALAMIKHIEENNKLSANVTDPSQRLSPYIVASQDEKNILDRLRHMGTAPLIRLSSATVLILEQPSKSSRRLDANTEAAKWKAAESAVTSKDEEELVQLCQAQERRKRKLAQQQLQALETNGMVPKPPPRKRGKAKGANPLSCKKKHHEGN